MFTGHTLVLQNTFGRDVRVMRAVMPDELVGAFDTLCGRAESISCPIIFVDGYGYTNRRDFMDSLVARNAASLNAGGALLFEYPGARAAAAPFVC